MTTYDPTVQQAVEQAKLDAEMAQLMQNRPQYTQAVPGTNSQIESGNTRAVISSAAEIPMWNRETGEQSVVIFDALRARMRQKFATDHPNPRYANSRVYTLHPHGCECGEPSCEPAPAVTRGDMSCPLSIHNGDRAEAESLGYGDVFCRKPAYFKSSLAVERHVEKSHPEYFRNRKRAEEDREKRADRELQRMILDQLADKPRGRKAAE